MKKPVDFDGAKFAAKYNLDPFKDFYDDGKGSIVCPFLPNLTDSDLSDCIADPLSPYEVFKKPISAPDFIVSTPKINKDPEKALDEAIAEMEKGEGNPKSVALIALSMAKYLKSKKAKLE